MGRLKTRAGALIAALAVLGMTAAAAVLLLRLDRQRTKERLTDDAQAAARRAADGVRTLLGGLKVQVQNGTANPRLVAALDAKVDEETMRDLLLTEPWWETFRRSVDGFGLYSDESAAVVTSRPAGRVRGAESGSRRATRSPCRLRPGDGRRAGPGGLCRAGGAHQPLGLAGAGGDPDARRRNPLGKSRSAPARRSRSPTVAAFSSPPRRQRRRTSPRRRAPPRPPPSSPADHSSRRSSSRRRAWRSTARWRSPRCRSPAGSACWPAP